MVSMIEAQRAGERREPQLGRVLVEPSEPLELRGPERVPDIIAQVPFRHSLAAGVVRIVRPGHAIGVGNAPIAGRLQQADVRWGQRVRPSGPDGVDKGQPGRFSPQLTEVELPYCGLWIADCGFRLWIQEERGVADDER